ncbi:hypothetical protein DKG74_06875 [Zavarzinia aquatilis]|uniref:Uncharacterized protein n=2 Tax=Zavarzinia aquatilis TaxID=2211142 RepID=A0A317ED45_9PROT|nr:hypothetical protein DKG74_06875 [Zavarzinia aquatilis]
MFKVIVERPRVGSRHAPSPKLKRLRDPGVSQIGLGRHALVGTRYAKGLNENLAPLARFLRSRLGRRWDAVFSEICAGLDTRSTLKSHVRLHLDDIVLSRISIGRRGEWLSDGRVIGGTGRGGRRFFVDPRDGILKDCGALPAANRPRKGGAR